MAKAKWGVSNQGCVAQLQDDNYGYELVRVRHPLIDSKKVVANNIVCTNGKKIILITGANTAGKTVLLKTIGHRLISVSVCVTVSWRVLPMLPNQNRKPE